MKEYVTKLRSCYDIVMLNKYKNRINLNNNFLFVSLKGKDLFFMYLTFNISISNLLLRLIFILYFLRENFK